MTDRLVVIGGDASGMTAASLVKKRRPDMEVVALEKGHWTSYSACGIPYLVGGDVDTIDDLVVRTPEEHIRRGVDARVGHEATGIDLDRRHVEVRDLDARPDRRYCLPVDCCRGKRPQSGIPAAGFRCFRTHAPR